MVDRFESSLRKLDRARKHADDLAGEISAFWAANPCELEPVYRGPVGTRRLRVRRLSPNTRDFDC
jgi:hypothetical protein